MTLIIVEAVPVGIKPPAAGDSMRTSTCGKCGFGTSAPLLTRASPVHFPAATKRGFAIMSKLVKLVGPLLTLAEEYPRASLDLLQRPHTLASSYIVLRLPRW